VSENGAVKNGRSDWWKWTAAILGALVIGLLPYIFASSQYVTQDELDLATQQVEVKIDQARQQIIAAQSTDSVEIAKLQAQMVDLIDRIEQLRGDLEP
jgi:uncharacterized protein YpmS